MPRGSGKLRYPFNPSKLSQAFQFDAPLGAGPIAIGGTSQYKWNMVVFCNSPLRLKDTNKNLKHETTPVVVTLIRLGIHGLICKHMQTLLAQDKSTTPKSFSDKLFSQLGLSLFVRLACQHWIQLTQDGVMYLHHTRFIPLSRLSDVASY